VLRTTMASVALRRADERTKALQETVADLMEIDEARTRFAALMSGLGIRYDLGEGHPLLGRRMPDLELAGAEGPQRVFALLHAGRAVLLDLGAAEGLDAGPWRDRVQTVRAAYEGPWELPAIGTVSAPSGVLIRPDGYVAWVGEGDAEGLEDALGAWFGPATASTTTSRPVGGS